RTGGAVRGLSCVRFLYGEGGHEPVVHVEDPGAAVGGRREGDLAEDATHRVRVGAAERAEVHDAARGHEAGAEPLRVLGVAGPPVAVLELLDRLSGAVFLLILHALDVSLESMSRTLVELSDRWDLQDLMTAYATCIDARDFDGLDAVFLPDARVSFEASGGPD